MGLISDLFQNMIKIMDDEPLIKRLRLNFVKLFEEGENEPIYSLLLKERN